MHSPLHLSHLYIQVIQVFWPSSDPLNPGKEVGVLPVFLGIIFLCVATLCKIARSRVLQARTWTAGSLCSDLQAYRSPTNATSTLPQHRGQSMTNDQGMTSGFPSNFLLRWVTKSSSDSHIYLATTSSTFEMKIQ